MGKAMANGFPIAALGGRRDLLEQFSTVPGAPVMLAGTYNGHPGMAARRARHDQEARDRARARAHLPPRRARALRAAGDVRRSGVTSFVTGFGSVWVSYFLEGPVSSYTDLLRNDADLYVGYRRRLLEHGIFELPMNLKRNHFTYAHTDAARRAAHRGDCVGRGRRARGASAAPAREDGA